ncbi:MAG: hypothetical protein ACKVKF_15005, partial [Rhodobacterales bacterium]
GAPAVVGGRASQAIARLTQLEAQPGGWLATLAVVVCHLHTCSEQLAASRRKAASTPRACSADELDVSTLVGDVVVQQLIHPRHIERLPAAALALRLIDGVRAAVQFSALM